MQCTKRRKKFLIEQVELVLGHPSVLLTIKEFSRITGHNEHGLRKLCARDEIRHHQSHKGATYRIHFTELDPFFPKEVAA